MTKYLILENGAVFEGKSFGYDGEAVGELVFTTKMTGYLESLSDPAYYGQILLQTFPLIGNYGAITQDFGPGPIFLKAYIVKSWCQEPSNFRSEGNLDSFLCEHKIPGLYDIDTRALARVIRDNGTMNAMLTSSPELNADEWAKLKSYKIENAVATVCAESNYSPGNFCANSESDNTVIAGLTRNPPGDQVTKGDCGSEAAMTSDLGDCGSEAAMTSDLVDCCSEAAMTGSSEKCYNIAMWDLGDGFRASKLLAENGLNPLTFNYATSAANILAKKPDGIMLTGGPGDPTENVRIIDEIKKLCESGANIPIFAVGLGHQLLALAHGAKIVKLKFGNRGANQPVRENMTERAFVTQQNHSYTVTPDSLPETAVVSYSNINDGTCEGIDYTNIPAFSIQFEPTRHMMERFRKLISN